MRDACCSAMLSICSCRRNVRASTRFLSCCSDLWSRLPRMLTTSVGSATARPVPPRNALCIRGLSLLVPHDVNRGPIFSCGGIDMGKTVGFLCDDSCLDRKVLGMYALLANFANAEDLIANTSDSMRW